jgi:Flp pilus assembly protein TadD
LGMIYGNIGRTADAIEVFTKLDSLAPNDAETQNRLGFLLGQNGKIPEALEHINLAIKLRPDFAEAYFSLAMISASENKMSEARAAALKALELSRSQGQTEIVEQIERWLKSINIEKQ